MVTKTRSPDDRLPTAGPVARSFERYRVETTSDEDVRIVDEEATDAWLQAASSVPLDDWR